MKIGGEKKMRNRDRKTEGIPLRHIVVLGASEKMQHSRTVGQKRVNLDVRLHKKRISKLVDNRTIAR